MQEFYYESIILYNFGGKERCQFINILLNIKIFVIYVHLSLW